MLSKLEFDGGVRSRVVKPREPVTLRFAAEDANHDKVVFVTWILEAKARKAKALAGPFPQASPGHAVITAPKVPGEYLFMVYARDNRGAASASTLPFKVSGDALNPSKGTK